MSFVSEIYESQFAPHLQLGSWGGRAETFRQALTLLEAQARDHYVIVETGTLRQPVDEQFWTNGASTLIWDQLINYYDGSCHSFDIDPEVQAVARGVVSEKSTLVCSDSVAGLWQHCRSVERIDLLYLDSMDLCWVAPEPSSLHHVKELATALRSLHPGSLVLVDDSPRSEHWLPPWVAVWNQANWAEQDPITQLLWTCETIKNEALGRLAPQDYTPDIGRLLELFNQAVGAMESQDREAIVELTGQLRDAFLRCIPGTSTHPGFETGARCPGKGLYACELLDVVGEKVAHDYQALYRIT